MSVKGKTLVNSAFDFARKNAAKEYHDEVVKLIKMLEDDKMIPLPHCQALLMKNDDILKNICKEVKSTL